MTLRAPSTLANFAIFRARTLKGAQTRLACRALLAWQAELEGSRSGRLVTSTVWVYIEGDPHVGNPAFVATFCLQMSRKFQKRSREEVVETVFALCWGHLLGVCLRFQVQVMHGRMPCQRPDCAGRV